METQHKDHNRLIEATVPWSSDRLTMSCLPFYSSREDQPGCQFSNLFPCDVCIDTGQRLPGSDETFLVHPEDSEVTFKSTEHAFQCAKALHARDDRFVRELTPFQAAMAGQGHLKLNGKQRRLYESLGGNPVRLGSGRKRKVRLSENGRYLRRSNWDTLKLAVMTIALQAKFAQHPELIAEQVEAEHMTFFIEHTVNDAQWGDGGDGSGTNFLGKLLTTLLWEFRTDERIDRQASDDNTWLRTVNRDLIGGFYEER